MTVSIAELAVPYAVLALYDSEKPITADAIVALLEAANIEVERVWAEVFAKAFQDPSKVAKLVEAVGAGAASAPAAQAAASGASAAAAPKEEKKETKAAPKEESDEEMGFGLFD
jgi:large subunit ribosomal protein LP1